MLFLPRKTRKKMAKNTKKGGVKCWLIAIFQLFEKQRINLKLVPVLFLKEVYTHYYLIW